MIAPVDPYVAQVLASIEAAEKAAGLVPVDLRDVTVKIHRDKADAPTGKVTVRYTTPRT